MTGPGSKNEFAKKASPMKIPNEYDDVDYGKKTKVTAQTVDVVDSKNGKLYGSKTIISKESVVRDKKWQVEYDHFGTNSEVPLYHKSVTVTAPNQDEAIRIVKNLVGGRNHKATLVSESSAQPTFITFLSEQKEDDNITLLPAAVISEIKKNIRDGAKDTTQAWANALELTNTAYYVSNVRLPRPDQKGAWDQYEELLRFSVRQLSDNRGIGGDWRIEKSLVKESTSSFSANNPIGKHRFFVEIPGELAQEVEGDNMDEIIDQIITRIRVGKEVRGTKARVEFRNEYGARIAIYVDDVLRERITIKEIS